MAQMKKQSRTTSGFIKTYNKPLPLVDYLLPLIGSKKTVKIADIGSGPFSLIGAYFPGVDLEIYHSDKQDFVEFWSKRNLIPAISVEYQDMENLTYPDNFFDVVHCLNALDHTLDAKKAVEEMIRVCQVGGWVYIVCALNQLDTGHKHYWNAKQDGIFTDRRQTFDLKDFGFKIEFVDNGGESRHNQIIATLQKE